MKNFIAVTGVTSFLVILTSIIWWIWGGDTVAIKTALTAAIVMYLMFLLGKAYE